MIQVFMHQHQHEVNRLGLTQKKFAYIQEWWEFLQTLEKIRMKETIRFEEGKKVMILRKRDYGWEVKVGTHCDDDRIDSFGDVQKSKKWRSVVLKFEQELGYTLQWGSKPSRWRQLRMIT